ncbi:Cryptochrome DASH [compost metagenome]
MHSVLSTYPETEQDPVILGPFIAAGALSPILLYNNIKKLGEGKKDKRFEKIIDILLWRDYFRFMLKKYPNVFFKSLGTKNSTTADVPALTVNEELFEKWKSGQTAHDFINSTMIQLKKTGYIPYQAGLIAASYLVHEYQVNWLKGASWFEEKLLDYSPATVYGQWSHIAGVGTSEKDNKALDWQKLIKTNFPNGLPKLDELLAK